MSNTTIPAGHKQGCKCPVCAPEAYPHRGPARTSAHFGVRLDLDIIDWIRSQAEGARAYITRLVRADRDKPRLR